MNVPVIVPSLDPDEKLELVVEGLLREGFRDIVLVNDGSRADHVAPFQRAAAHPEVTVLTHEVNKGKGVALKTAFAWCLEHRPGISGVVTADGDNQHRAEDIRRCAEAMERQPDKVWLGVRDFSLEQVPLRSRLGNTVTRCIMRLCCGVSVTDTQTGLRAVPAAYLPLMCRIDGERYEYETEMLIALHREHIPVGEVVIETVYIDENQTSHFNTLRDSWKIYRIILRHVRRSLISFLKFSASSLLSVIIDQGLFALLNSVALVRMGDGLRVFIATVAARICSSLFNFYANHKVVFRGSGSTGSAMGRYYVLCAAQTACSYGLVYLFTELWNTAGLGDSLVKVIVDGCLFLVSYQIQKHWVFRKK